MITVPIARGALLIEVRASVTARVGEYGTSRHFRVLAQLSFQLVCELLFLPLSIHVNGRIGVTSQFPRCEYL